jgi:hypothetical protein
MPANRWATPEWRPPRPSSTVSAARRPCRPAARTRARGARPRVSTAQCRLRPLTRSPPSQPRAPPASLVRAVRPSMVAAVGRGPRPASRLARSARGVVDPLADAGPPPSSDWSWTQRQGGDRSGRSRRARPPRRTRSTASDTNRPWWRRGRSRRVDGSRSGAGMPHPTPLRSARCLGSVIHAQLGATPIIPTPSSRPAARWWPGRGRRAGSGGGGRPSPGPP